MTAPKADYHGELTKRVRLHTGLTQKQIAAMFGLSLRSWQDKELGKNRVSVAELLMFQLLLNEHPDYVLRSRLPAEMNAAQKAAEDAFTLGEYLLGQIPLPSRALALQNELNHSMTAFRANWQDELNEAVGGALPDELTVLRAKLCDAEAEISKLKKRLVK